MADTRVSDAYAARAHEYAALFGTVDAIDPRDRAFVLRWAGSVVGPVVDAGCGPGQWTALLDDAGVNVVGVDPTAPFVEMARRIFPTARFRSGTFDDLGVVVDTRTDPSPERARLHRHGHSVPSGCRPPPARSARCPPTEALNVASLSYR